MSHSADQQFIFGEVARAGQGLDTVHPHLSEQQLSYGKWPWLGKMGRGRVGKNILEVEMRVVAMAGQGREGEGWIGGGLRLATTHSSL